MNSVFIELKDLEFCELTALQILADSVEYVDYEYFPVLEVVYKDSSITLNPHTADCDGVPMVESYQELAEHLKHVNLNPAKVSTKLSNIFGKMMDAQPTYLLQGELEVIQKFDLGDS